MIAGIRLETAKAILENNWRTLREWFADDVYTPTLTNGANVASSSALACMYLRTGKGLHVDGAVSVTPAAAATFTSIGISLPRASVLAAAENLCGAGAYVPNGGTTQAVAQLLADTTNNRALLQFVSLSTAAHTFRFSFGYRVLP